MDENRVSGSIDEVRGAAKEAAGKSVGDARLQSGGKAGKPVCRIPNYAGSLNAAVRDTEAMKSAGLLVGSPIKRDTGL
jgi:uncharacterized protein YjbJ (UPF0337 family)